MGLQKLIYKLYSTKDMRDTGWDYCRKYLTQQSLKIASLIEQPKYSDRNNNK